MFVPVLFSPTILSMSGTGTGERTGHQNRGIVETKAIKFVAKVKTSVAQFLAMATTVNVLDQTLKVRKDFKSDSKEIQNVPFNLARPSSPGEVCAEVRRNVRQSVCNKQKQTIKPDTCFQITRQIRLS